MNCNQLFQSDFCFNSGADESWLSVAYRHVLSCNFKEIFLKRWLKNLICKMYYYIRKCCNIKKEHKQLHLVKRCHSSRNDLYSMSLSSNLFKLSKHIMHSFRKNSLISETCQIEHTKHKKWNWPGFCHIQGKTISWGAFQQTCEAPLSVDCGSERPSRDSQLEIFTITQSLESDNSDRLSLLTFTPQRSPANSQINSENICFVPPYAS